MDPGIIDSPATICSRESDDVIAEPIVNLVPVEIYPNMEYSPEQLHLLSAFPWISEFNKFCRTDIGNTNLRHLERMMRFFQKNKYEVGPYNVVSIVPSVDGMGNGQVYQSVKDCYSRPNRAAKLKRVMSDALLFFHMTYSELKAPLEHSSYLAKMSDLMAMYLDMEIKASRTGTESLPKIASKLTSALHVYFGRSRDHILDTILKSRIMSKSYWELSDLIFRWVLRDSPGSNVYIFSYIRYLLAFKKWKMIMKGAEERKKIAKLATVKLQAPPNFREKMSAEGILRDLLPRVPRSRTDITLFLMQAKFAVRDKIKIFLKTVMDPKLQCALDRQNFLSNEVLVNPGVQLESESNTIMNDIWSSMNIADSARDPLRLSHFGEKKKYLKAKNQRKTKPDLLKRRRKKIEVVADEIGEDDKPTSEINDVIKNIKLEVVEAPTIEPEDQANIICETDDTMEIAAEVELSSNSPSESDNLVKEEPQNSRLKNPIEYQMVWNDQNFQAFYANGSFEYETSGKGLEYVLPDDPSLNTGNQTEIYEIETKDSETIEIVDDSLSANPEIVDDNIEIPVSYSPKDQIVVQEYKEVEYKESDIKDSDLKETDFTTQELNKEQEFKEPEYKPPDGLNNEDFEADKSLDKDLNIAADYNIEDNGMGMLHDYTIKSDSKMYEFQMKVYSYSSKLTAQTWISLLSPVFCEQSRLKMYRCWCAGCKNNLCVIRRNWKSVMAVIMLNSEKSEEDAKTATDENGYSYEDSLEDLKAVAEGEKGDIMYWEAEIESLLKKIDECVKEDSESSSLPLKKRKAFSYSNSSNFAKEDKAPEMSYPCTPMISIAEIELVKEKFKFNNTVGVTPSPAGSTPVNYVANYSTHSAYPTVTDPKYNSVIVQSVAKPVTPEQNIVPNLVPGAYTTTFIPDHQEKKLTFKTPAQLKEFQHLSAARDLINFAHTSRTYSESQMPPPKRQTRQKTKSQSRKRKRT